MSVVIWVLSIVVFVLALAVTALAYVLWSTSRVPEGSWAALDAQDTRDPGFARMVAHLCLDQACDGNSVTLLQNGDGFWPALIDAIGAAESSVHFETFLWKTGELSGALVDAFVERARAGVEVRLIVDAEGGKRMTQAERARLREAGVELQLYRRASFEHLGSYNRRDHRKLAVIDGSVGFCGGHCVTDAWLGDAQDREHNRDLSVRLEGPIVGKLQAAFSENWTETSGELLAKPAYFPELGAAGDVTMHLAYLGDQRRVTAVKTLYVLAVEAAQERLDIMNPYFLPDERAEDALRRAVERGVRVRVMTPTEGATDNAAVLHAMMAVLPRLLDAGVEVYGYDRTLLHQKTIAVDGCWAIVGSVNFDARSFGINEEIAVSIFDPSLAVTLEEAFDADLEHCVDYSEVALRDRSLPDALTDRLAWGIRDQL